MHLKNRTFRIGTWNTRGKIMAKPGLAPVNKVTAAEDIMSVESIDLLVLTETHTDDAHPVTTSRWHIVLAQTSISTSKAGVAILAPNDGSWTCQESIIIVPGHTILAWLNHQHSTEAFWLLAIYGDVSGGHASLLTFYRDLRNFLADLIYSPEHSATWSGCLAAGDWNAVEHPDDRTPPAVPSALRSDIKRTFAHIKSLCHLQDAAGRKALLHGHTFTGTGPTTWMSRIDQIYHPQDSWWAKKPTAIPTLWSDHKLVWAECGITAPHVQIAKVAPHLPSTDALLRNKDFWGPALERYSTLANNTVTLEVWTTFKKDILTLGLKVRCTTRKNRSAEWRAALWGDAIPLEELPATLDKARQYVPKQTPSPQSCRWRSALRGDPTDAQPRSRCLPKMSCYWQSSLTPPPPWQPQTSRPPYRRNPEPTPNATPWLTGHAPVPWARAAELLTQRIES